MSRYIAKLKKRKHMKKVLIIQKAIKHYRLPFYEKLYEILLEKNINLLVAYSELNVKEIKSKKDNSVLPEKYSIKVPSATFLSGKLVYQFVLNKVNHSDLVIVEQANKNLINFILLLKNIKVGYWGHGRNLQGDPNSVKEKFKSMLLKSPYWWFAYTQSTKDFLVEQGFPERKITNVNNSIDTKSLANDVSSLSDFELETYKKDIGISYSKNIGLFCGSLYEKKLLPFLVDSCIKIKVAIPDFTLLILGAGPSEDWVKEICEKHDWIVYLGPSFGKDKALAFRCSKVVLNPGLVGLGILDALASGRPMITTDYPYHSPEVSYLENNYNGLITLNNINDFSQSVTRLLKDKEELERMSKNSLLSSQYYTTDIMALNFAEGIEMAISN
jgi:glycosyltransferase involved in cell wall biosynthesis